MLLPSLVGTCQDYNGEVGLHLIHVHSWKHPAHTFVNSSANCSHLSPTLTSAKELGMFASNMGNKSKNVLIPSSLFEDPRLVGNLCTVWIGSHHLHANVARFNRPAVDFTKAKQTKAGEVRGHSEQEDQAPVECEGKSVKHMVLDESCVNEKDYSLCLNGKLKNLVSLDNLKIGIEQTLKKGSSDVDIRYLGGMWVMFVFKSLEVKEKFLASVAINSWFSHLVQSFNDFVVDGRIMWVDVEGVPLKMWSFNTFKKIGAKWGTLLDVENKEDENYHSKRLCIHTKGITNVFESFKIVYKGKVYWVRAKEVSGWIPDFELTDEDGSESDESQSDDGLQEGVIGDEEDKQGEDDVSVVPDSMADKVNDNDGEDIEQNEAVDKNSTDPFGFYSLLRKNKQKDNHESSCKESLKFPPGFTPREEESVGSGHFQQSEIPRSGGSLLNVMDELIRVGQTMGYKMEGCLNPKAKKDWVKELCVSHKVDFLSLQETKMEDINIFDIKKCWGNFVFDYVFSESNGFSGGILCIWNPTVFNKYSTTVSDYFIIVRGKWISNGKLLLIISVYAPQEALEKKMLWDYLNHIIISWKGEVILMGDFNEVRYKNERYGSVFNVQGAKVFNSFIANSNLVEVPLGGLFLHVVSWVCFADDNWERSNVRRNIKKVLLILRHTLIVSFGSPSILLRETNPIMPIPFSAIVPYGIDMEGFDKHVMMLGVMPPIFSSNAITRQSITNRKRALQKELGKLDMIIDNGKATEENLLHRMEVCNSIQELDKLHNMEVAQKAKHHQLAIRGVMKDGVWEEKPDVVADLEAEVSIEEIKKAVWDCGTDKAPGPDGFTFGFYKRYWGLITSDVREAASMLGDMDDRWRWTLDGSGDFSVASVRRALDDIRLPCVSTQTRWIKEVPI
ncbi:RNA-directed DNA polymerase, eukaryota, partial [Tanacetum coccineum]